MLNLFVEFFQHYLWLGIAGCYVSHAWQWLRGEHQNTRASGSTSEYRRLFLAYVIWSTAPWLAMGAGIMSGRVDQSFDYILPAAKNPYVLAWWGLLCGMLCLKSIWIYLTGGDRVLEKHPDLFMMPMWSAEDLKLYWSGVLAWCATLFFFSCFLPMQREDLENGQLRFPIFILFIGIWTTMCFMLAANGGWGALSKKYSARESFPGSRHFFQSAEFGSVGYGGVLTFGADSAGVFISIFAMCRPGHPPLFIPWSKITVREVRRWFGNYIEFQFEEESGIRVRVSRKLGDKLLKAGGISPIPAVNAALR